MTIALLAATVPVSSTGAEDFKIITSAKSAPASIKRQDLARLFLKKSSRWPDGQPAVPVDQSSRTTVRLAFTRDILKVEGLGQISAVEGYWQQLIFSGRGTPPAVKASDAEVVAFVAVTPGAVGYVSGAADTGEVRTISVAN